jgi:hypothetical protein
MKQIAFFIVSLVFVLGVPLVDAGVNVGISIGVPEPLVFEEPPDVVVVPSGSAYVYMVPDSPGLYFYNNFWYRFYEDHWYRSRIYNGSWVYLDTRRVPRFILDVPPDYYNSLAPGYYRIHYGDLHRNWRTWDRGRHWNRYDWYRHEHERRGHDRGRDLHDGGRGHDGRGHDGHGRDLHDDHGRRDGGHGLRDGRGGRDGHGLRDGDHGKRDGLGGPGGGHKPKDMGGNKHDGGGTKQYGGTQKGAEGRRTHPDDKKEMEHKR